MVKEKLELKEAPKGFNLMPDCSGAMDELEELVYKKAGEKYGDILPDEVAKRISMELDMVPSDVFAKNLLMNVGLVSTDLFADKRFFVRGTAGNSFINYLIGLSSLNPLSKKIGGYGLEPEFFFGVRKKRSTPAVEISCPMSKLDGIRESILGLSGVKDVIWAASAVDFPALHRYIVIPEGVDESDLPFIELDSGRRVLAYDDCSIDDENVLKFTVTGMTRFDILTELETKTGVASEDVDFTDPKVAARLMNPEKGFLQMLSGPVDYPKGIIEKVGINDISDLTTVYSLMCGTDVWFDNLENLIEDGTVHREEIIATRDECYDFIYDHDLYKEDALRITESIRIGRGIPNGDKVFLSRGLVPDWFYHFADKVKFMFPRAHSIAVARMIWEEAYFMEYYPNEYEEVQRAIDN